MIKIEKVYQGDVLPKEHAPFEFSMNTIPADGIIAGSGKNKIFLRWEDLKEFHESDADIKEIDSWRDE